PELPAQRDLIIKVIKEEEDAFLRTLDNGIRLLDGSIAEARREGRTEITGKEAFTLYDTYGFPLDLTELILKENGMTLDQAGFDAEMAAQKARARNAAATEATDWVTIREGEPEFVGYDVTSTPTHILRYRKVKQKKQEYYQLVLSISPFYAEMGGQVGDRGTLSNGDGETIEVYDTKRENGLPVCLTLTLPSDPGATFTATIDEEAREATSANHTATHLLHHALRQVLGTHVEQKGSFVSPDLLRFDFSHFQKVTPEQLREVEHIANRNVRRAIARDEHRNLPIAEARAMGAMALFGEKYGEEVRVIRYGESVELCGGTHVANTGNIGMIRIVSESSIAAGIRRIEAITGRAVEDALDKMSDTMHEIGAMLGGSNDITAAVHRALDENSELRGQVEDYFKERVANMADGLIAKARQTASGVKLVALNGKHVPDAVKAVAFAVRAKSPENTAFVAATTDISGKPLLTVMVTDDLTAHGLNAATIVRTAAKLIKGGGGGQPGFAQAGGKDGDAISAAFDALLGAID
ncbi:MAG: alanine--tRNA ligase, partial [Paramuribaculum sp.]|nr:alanine--tRNA ligase [Paramuribaculum sp.]